LKNFPRVFKRKTIQWTAGLFILLIAVAVIIFWFSANRPPVIAESGLQIGSRGPFEIPFNKKMQVKSVEQSIVIDPQVNGQFSWEGSTVRYWPSEPLNVGTAYRVTLLPGSKSADGRAIRETASWQFTVRNPLVAFLHPAASPELWLYDPVDESVRQISHTDGKVYDFGSSTAGNLIAFSAANSQGGIDLWQYSRKTEAVEKILDCGRDWCFNPAWSPADDRIAYTRRAAGEAEAAQPGVPRVHILEYSSAKDWILYDTDSVAGYSPRWSPDGRYLAFFDTIAAGIRIFDLTNGKAVVVQTQSGLMGSWSPDGQQMAFINFQQADTGQPFSVVYFFEPQTGTLRKYPAGDVSLMDFGVPAWSPDGEWIAISLQPSGKSPSKQIWLMHPDGSDARAVTADEGYTHAGYSFSPDGALLVYQLFSLTGSQARPELRIWERESGEGYSIAEDAALPAWVP
jgi:TolB protein